MWKLCSFVWLGRSPRWVPFLGTVEFFAHVNYMTEECYTAHPWMLAAKWHPNRVLILHYIIANPCSAITFHCAQWSKLMSPFYSGRTGMPLIFFFFELRDIIYHRENCNGCFCTCFVKWRCVLCCPFCFWLNPSRCVSLIHFSTICEHSCVGLCVFLHSFSCYKVLRVWRLFGYFICDFYI